eukprot:SAG22_NODE_10914_length_510_cov_0.591241_1_plen_109_part_10
MQDSGGGSGGGSLKTTDDAALRRQLAVDPSFEIIGLSLARGNVTKEPTSPILRRTLPWEVTLGYVSAVFAPESQRFILYYTGHLCCSGKSIQVCCNGSSVGEDLCVQQL